MNNQIAAAPELVHITGAPVPEWTPPRTRWEADQAILSLSNDIGLILAQLAEDQDAWTSRTGRSAADYAAWRRRALFAKVHKEAQLRECKRMRALLSDGEDVGELLVWCHDVVEAWLDDGAPLGDRRLGTVLAGFAEYLDRIDAAGARARPVG
jgi:hypothetical protein